MPAPILSDADFVREFEALGAQKLATKHGCTVRSVYGRRIALEKKLGRQLTPPHHPNITRHNISHPHRQEITVENGIVLIGSDAHIWPGEPSTAMRAFRLFCKDMKPKAVILNGDVMDFPQVSRHPPIGWETLPTVKDEIEAAQEQLHHLEIGTPRGCRLIWTLGNHDSRFETRLATVAPEYAKLHGFHLQDHYPLWAPCWSAWINDDVVVKHRYRGGTHATHNNVVHSGKTMVTGHLHSLKVTPFSDYAPRPRWGVDSGTLADPHGKQFVDYQEDNPTNHRSGFVVLTFKNDVLLWPEVVHVYDKEYVEFRGEVIKV